MQTIEIHKKKTIIIKERVSIQTVKFINPHDVSRKCGACKKKINEERPIALVWIADKGSTIICKSCSSHLINTAEERTQ